MHSKPLYFCLVIGLLLFQSDLTAQCPEQGIPILKDEAAVDSFLIIYPNCDQYKVASFYAINGKQVFWIKEDVQGYLLSVGGVLLGIHILLYFLFRKLKWFQES